MNTALQPLFATSSSDSETTSATVIAYPYTGDYRIDVLLPSAQEKWLPDLAAGQPRTVTYSFALAEGYLSNAEYESDVAGFTPFTQVQMTATRSILNYISSVLAITFVEVTETASSQSATGDIRLCNNDQDSAGYAVFPTDSDLQARGDVFLANSSISSGYAAGSYNFDTILHELTHALGLKHPGNYNAGSAASNDPGNYLASSEDSKTLSVVSYVEQEQGLQRVDFAPYDLLALGYLYGLKTQNVGNSTYTWSDSIGEQMQTLIDDGGTDTIDLSRISAASLIDLREGHSSNVGLTGQYASTAGIAALKNVQIAYGTVIENVKASPQADWIIGNSANNSFEGGEGNDTLDGGDGRDAAVWSGLADQYRVTATGNGNWTVQSLSGNEGSDQLQNIERLHFSDHNIALDLSGNAGTTAKILGAVFGRTAVSNAQFAGIGLHYLDDLNYSYASLMQLAINARLGTQASSAQVVDLLYTNVVGVAPDAVTRKSFAELLDSGTYSVASLGMLAAETDLNQTNINLTGLTQTGMEYLPVSG